MMNKYKIKEVVSSVSTFGLLKLKTNENIISK